MKDDEQSSNLPPRKIIPNIFIGLSVLTNTKQTNNTNVHTFNLITTPNQSFLIARREIENRLEK